MSSVNESGHIINVSNLQDIISYCSSYGTSYKPTQSTIQLAALQQLYTDAKNAINELAAKQAAYKNAVNTRNITFEPLKKLSTRILNAYIACGTSEQNIANVRYYINKIRGVRKTKALSAADATTSSTETTSHSNSQKGFDNLVGHYTNLLALLSLDELYQPNEYELSIKGLQDLVVDLETKNNAVINTTTTLSNARIDRNDVLYDDEDGLVERVSHVKKYVKSVFGTSSSQFKQVNSIHFRSMIK